MPGEKAITLSGSLYLLEATKCFVFYSNGVDLMMERFFIKGLFKMQWLLAISVSWGQLIAV